MNHFEQGYPRVGDILLYTIKPGDNLYRIAQNFNTELNWILMMNNLKEDQYIYPNQQLLIPVLYQKPMPNNPIPPIPAPMKPRDDLNRNQYDMFF